MKTYTFHVSLPGDKEVWRQIELPADFTLEALHLAIQDAYAFDNDHLYSFFMSGKAWDTATEYALPEGADPWGDLFEDEEDEEAEDEAADAEDAEEMAADDEDDELPDPTPAELMEMFQALKDSPELLAEAKKQVTEQLGIPGFLFDMIVNNSDQVMQMMGIPALLAGMSPSGDIFGATPPVGDVRETTLDMLKLRKGKRFMYLFDYGDEWRFSVRVTAVNERADPDAEYPRLVESVGEAPEQYSNWEDYEDDDEIEDEAEL